MTRSPTHAAGDAHVARLRALVGERLGLRVDDDRVDALLQAARALAGSDGNRELCDLLDALERRAGTDATEALHGLGEALAVGESYFFRNAGHMDALVERAVPERLRASPLRPLRILSAGCASGEEPGTIAMVLDARLPALDPRHVEIVGFDIDRRALARAEAASYGRWSLRQTPEPIRERYFRRRGHHWDLVPPIRERIALRAGSLADPDADVFAPGQWDVVFCRNVFIYFTPEAIAETVRRFARALRPGGFLFLGETETLRGVSDAFGLCHSHETFYYRLGAGDVRDIRPPASVRSVAPPEPEPRPATPTGAEWLDAIALATARIQELSASVAASTEPHGETSRRRRRPEAPSRPLSGRPRTTARDPAAVPPATRLAPVLDLVRIERFEDALRALDDLDGSSSPGDPAAATWPALVRAALLFHVGKTREAEAEARGVLARDALEPAAHYVLARCREEADDPAQAAEHAVSAVFLEPRFALAHMLLGDLALRGGDPARARRHLQEALALLPGEDETRILLFGGGFGREALVGLCAAALAPDATNGSTNGSTSGPAVGPTSGPAVGPAGGREGGR